MNRTVAKIYPIWYKIILQMIRSNKGALKENLNRLEESMRIPLACVCNLHSVEDSFSEMSKIDSFKKISIPFLVHQANAEKRGFCKERKCSQSTVEETHDDERNSKCKNTKETIDDRSQATRS